MLGRAPADRVVVWESVESTLFGEKSTKTARNNLVRLHAIAAMHREVDPPSGRSLPTGGGTVNRSFVRVLGSSHVRSRGVKALVPPHFDFQLYSASKTFPGSY